MRDLKKTFSHQLPGTARVLFYSPLEIIKLYPYNGALAGGTEVFIEGKNFDLSFGGLYCKFGAIKVQATAI